MRDERFEVTVTFDERRGYIVTAPELRQPVLALSLGGLWNLRTPSAMARPGFRGASPTPPIMT